MSVGSDRTARLWDPQTGTGTPSSTRGGGPLYALAVSADGRWVASPAGTGRRTIQSRLYDVATGKVGRSLSWEVDDDVYTWTDGQLRRSREPVARSIWSLSFSADGQVLAAAGRRAGGGNILNGGGGDWWDTRKWERGDPFPADVYAAQFAPVRLVLAVTVRRAVRFYPSVLNRDEYVEFPVQCDWAPRRVPAGGERAVVAAGASVHVVVQGVDRGARKPIRVKTGMRR